MKNKEIKGSFTKNFEGSLSFNFYDGKGKLNFKIDNSNFSQISGSFFVEKIDMSEIASSFNEKIVINGFLNLKGSFYLSKGDKEIELIFYSSKKKGIKQYMNFGAIELLTSLSGQNPIRKIGSSNFYYDKIGGKITIKKNNITIEGLLGEKGKGQYLITKPFLLPGINLLIDKRNNTIEISQLLNRINLAIERIKEK